MSFLRPKINMQAPPPPPPPPARANEQDTERAMALAEEGVRKTRRKRGAGSTIVAGALGEEQGRSPTGGRPTLLG